MVDRRQNSPFRLSAIDRVIFEHLAGGPLPRQIAELHAAADGGVGQFVNRAAAVKQPQMRLLHERHPPRVSAFKLNQSRHEIDSLFLIHSVTSNLSSACFVDGQAQARNVFVQINEAVFGFGLAVEDVPE